MKIKYLCALLLAALTYSCDDTTPGIGDTTIPDGDHIQAGGKIYDVTTRSILADSSSSEKGDSPSFSQIPQGSCRKA